MSSRSVDNQHSFAGLDGLANPIVTAADQPGHDELVALTPEEMRREEIPPSCGAPKEEGYEDKRGKLRWRKLPGRCLKSMLYRAEGWVCYEHREPVRVKRPPRLQEIPAPPFSTFQVIGKEVSLVYSSEGYSRPCWQWIVDGEVWRP